MRPLGVLLWTAACHGLFQILVYGLSLVRGTLDLMTLGAAQALVYLLGVWLMLRMFDADGPLRQSLGLRPTDPGLGLIGMGLGVCLKLPAESLTNLIERMYPTSEAQLLARAELFRTDGALDVLVLLVVLCLAGPLVEEVFFRGASYGRLVKAGPRVAAAVSGLGFVVVHSDIRHWPALVIVAAVLSYLRVVAGSLLPCLGLHVAFNAAGVLALVTGAASPTRPLDVPALPLVGSWLGAGVLLGVSTRLRQNPEALRARAEDRA